MNEEFKKAILELYPECNRVYGPYTRSSDRRKIVTLTKNRKLITMQLLARVKLEVHMGRRLEGDETVDHIDENPLNDELDNLQVLSRSENSVKQGGQCGRPMSKFRCFECGKEFWIRDKDVESRKKENRSGPFCSSSCAGKYGSRIYHHEPENRGKRVHSEKLESRIFYGEHKENPK